MFLAERQVTPQRSIVISEVSRNKTASYLHACGRYPVALSFNRYWGQITVISNIRINCDLTPVLVPQDRFQRRVNFFKSTAIIKP